MPINPATKRIPAKLLNDQELSVFFIPFVESVYQVWFAADIGAVGKESGTVGFYGKTEVTIGDALTTADTSITHTAPGTADFAIQDLINSSSWGFASQDEGNTVLQVILNLQTRLNELEARLNSDTGVGLFT